MQNAHGAQPAAGDQQAKTPDYQLIYPLPWPAIRDVTDPSTKQEEFGHNRKVKKGESPRTHAGIDLVAPFGTPVLAMAAGTVVRMVPNFSQGTGAIEIAHPGLGIVRYGEVTPESIHKVCLYRGFLMKGQFVKPGQVIGFLGRREEHHPNGRVTYDKRSMLHLELYSDWEDDDMEAHRLSDPANHDYDNLPENLAHRAYQRRHDLLDPTDVVAGARVPNLERLGTFEALTQLRQPALSLPELLHRAVVLKVQNMPLGNGRMFKK